MNTNDADEHGASEVSPCVAIFKAAAVRIELLTTEQVLSYLRRTGWEVSELRDGWRWASKGDGYTDIHMDKAAHRWVKHTDDTIANVACCEGRPFDDVLAEIEAEKP